MPSCQHPLSTHYPSVLHPSSICKTCFLRNVHLNQCQILWLGRYNGHISRPFLGLLDYVSRAHGMGSQILVVNCFPWAICRTHFWIFEKTFFFLFFTNIFCFPYHGTLRETKLQNATPPSNHFWILSNFFWIFLLNGPHTSTVFNFWNFEFLIFQKCLFVFINMGPYGSKTSNATPPTNHFWIYPNFSWIFSSVVLTKVLFLGFSSC